MSSGPRTAIDLFCGAGGLSLGLHQVGIDTVLAVDKWTAAAATFRRNFPQTPVLETDLAQVATSELLGAVKLEETPDLIVGGPPCQGFSSAGARAPDDDRNNLVSVFAELVANMRPSVFLFENVEGFLTARHGDFVIALLEPLIDAGYKVQVAKINVANYGVPQLRKRVIAFGCLHGNPRIPLPTHRAWGAPGAPNVGSTSLPLAPTVADALRGLPMPKTVAERLSEEDLARFRALQPGQTMKDLPEELQHPSYRRRAFRRVRDGTPTERRGGAPAGLRRLRGNEPSKAITGAASRELIHPVANRPLTLPECARLQTFPDRFVFCGNKAERTLLIGNAVPPTFGAVLGRAALTALTRGGEEQSSRGRLLSFQPTCGSGMSPALRLTTERVRQQFGQEPQLALEGLWD